MIDKRSEWDVDDDKQHIIAVEDLVESNSLVTLDSRRFPAVQKRGLAAAVTLREVMQHPGSVAASQVTLPALTLHQLGTHLPECMSDMDSLHMLQTVPDIC